MLTRNRILIGAAMVSLVSLACGETPTETTAGSPEVQFAKGGKPKRPQSTELPLTVYVESDFNSSLPPADADASRVLGDGQGSYVDGLDEVHAYVLEGSNAGSMWLDLRGSTSRTFWVDLRRALDESSAVVDPAGEWLIDDACGTDELGTPSNACQSTQYLNTHVPPQPGPRTARLSVFWKDANWQYRMSYGRTCANDEFIESNQVDVTEILNGSGAVLGWLFETTTAQDAWVRRMAIKGGGKNRDQCLGRVKAPFRIRFELNQ